LVVVTKYRRKVITLDIQHKIEEIFKHLGGIYGVDIVEINGEEDHMHLLVEYPPTLALSKFVNVLKSRSSRVLFVEFPNLDLYLSKGSFWSRSYYAGSCGGASLEVVKQYVQNQRHSSPTQQVGWGSSGGR